MQVGTLFAYCNESGMDPELRRRVLHEVKTGSVAVKTSLRASSTGYPFKVASVSGTISDPRVYEERERKCDLGYLREAYVKRGGSTASLRRRAGFRLSEKGRAARSDRRLHVSLQRLDGHVRSGSVPLRRAPGASDRDERRLHQRGAPTPRRS